MTGMNRVPPFSTFTFILICVLVYVIQVVANPALQKFTLNPYNVFRGDWYRIISSPFMHGNFMHILMNIVSYWTLGSTLERKLGSLFMFFTILWSIIMSSLFHIAMATAMLLWTKGPFYGNSLGFSGVLFHLLVLECNLNPTLSRNIFGMLQMQSKYYPYALLILIQVIMPNISFLGHLSGIFVGSLQRLWGPMLIPRGEYLYDWDDRLLCSSCLGNYIDYIQTSRQSINDLYPSYSQPNASICIVFRQTFSQLFVLLHNIFETVKFIIVGRNDPLHSDVSRRPLVINDDEELALTRSRLVQVENEKNSSALI
jgi:membrane associated rhomboid family serine protease